MMQHQSARHELVELVAHIFSFQVFLSLLLLRELPRLKCAEVCVQDAAATAGVAQLGCSWLATRALHFGNKHC